MTSRPSLHVSRQTVLIAILIGLVAGILAAPDMAQAKCRSAACWQRVHDARAWHHCVGRHSRWACTLKRKWRRLPQARRGYMIAIRRCEAGTPTDGSAFIGRLEWSASTWRSAGGRGHPFDHPAEAEMLIGSRWLDRVGAHSTAGWPNCP